MGIVGSVRTTVTVDDDVMAEVDRLRHAQILGLSEALNHLARAGIAAAASSGSASYEHRSATIGIRVDVSNIGEVLELLDAD